MTTNFRWPEPTSIMDEETRRYLNELIRSLNSYDNAVFSQDTGLMFETARKRPFTAVTSSHSMGVNDSVLLVDASAATTTITLPLALDAQGTYYDIKKTDTNGATVVSVEGSGSEMPVVLNGSGRPSVTLFSDGSNFWII